MIGQSILHYRVLEKLGEGGMGVVYKAHDTKLDRDVALKFLPHYLTSDPTEKERFYHEARAAAALTHQNIAVVHEIGEHENQLFIAMEFVEGKTLKQLVESETLSVKKVLDIAVQVCEGLAAAHEKGIVHRDIKSDNIIVTPKGQTKIMDFGLAKVKGTTKLTKTGSTLGTAAYMSPEQALGEEVDHRSDIFSFGVVLYELFTNKLPFRGEHEASLMYSIVNEEPQPIARFNEKVTPELGRVVMKALAKDREERYQHADDLLADLRHERKGLEYSRAGYVRAPSAEQPVVEREPAKPKRNLPKYVIPITIIVAAVVLVVILNPFNLEIGPRKALPADRKSVAVLPFTNMSGNKEDEYFSDGITEDIITQISKISELKVISRTSVMQYKGVSKRLRDIGQELGVATVLEGSVRRAGNQVRIVAQLIDASTDEHLWAETYDRELTKIFAIQSEIAQQIAVALKAKLSPAEKERIEKKPTESLDAYTYYLKGREYYYRYRREENEEAIELFKRALELDRNYALAYAGLGDCYGQRASMFGLPDAWLDSAIAISNKAISIDPHLAEGYKALGVGYILKGWYHKALEANMKAVELNPNYFPAVGNIGITNSHLGNLGEALGWAKKAAALSPSVALAYSSVGIIYLKLGDDVKAERSFNKALELQPDLTVAHAGLILMYLSEGKFHEAHERSAKLLAISPSEFIALNIIGDAHLYSGDHRQAREFYEKAYSVSPYGRVAFTGWLRSTGLAYVYLKMGNARKANDLLNESLNRNLEELRGGSESPGVLYDLAAVHAVRGNKAEAYKWLQKAIDGGWIDYRIGRIDPLFENLRDDEDFKEMMDQVRVKVDEMRKRVEQTERE